MRYMLPSTSSNATQCDAKMGSDSIFASAALRFTNQFSEFYHNATDATQGFASLCEPSLRVWAKHGTCFHAVILAAATIFGALSVTMQQCFQTLTILQLALLHAMCAAV